MTPTFHEELTKHIKDVGDTLDTQDMIRILDELLSSPSMILETQQRLMALAFAMFQNDNKEATDAFRDASHAISRIVVAMKEKQ